MKWTFKAFCFFVIPKAFLNIFKPTHFEVICSIKKIIKKCPRKWCKKKQFYFRDRDVDQEYSGMRAHGVIHGVNPPMGEDKTGALGSASSGSHTTYQEK